MPRTTFYGNANLPMTTQPNIGLDTAARQSVVEILNLILADETVLSLKTRRVDEETSGSGIPDSHPLYEAQYKQINDTGSEIVERIHILGGSPLSDSEILIDSARLDGNLSADLDMMRLLADQEAFIRFLREDAQKCSEVYKDQGTYALLVGILRTHEKLAWILRSNIAVEQFKNEE